MNSSRRHFLRNLSGASLAALALPVIPSSVAAMPVGPADETYWSGIKAQFPGQSAKVMCNAANLCPAPTSVLQKVADYQRSLSMDVSMQYRAVFTERRKKSIERLATFLHADAEEIGITRNTSESNCTIVQGLDLKAGDEVILSDQNHPSNKEIWIERAKRTGIVVNFVKVPEQPKDTADLVSAFASAFTSRTKVLSFSHVSNVSGIALPAKELCALAKSRNVLTLVDGAQTLGFCEINVRDMGCDFYTASTHKWLMGPLENGVLYVRKSLIERVWPGITGGGWRDNAKTLDEKICILGQRNDPTTAALPEILLFHETIGKENIHRRVVELNTLLKEQIRSKVPTATFVTPLSPELSGGIVIVNLPGRDPKTVVQRLYDEFGIAAAATIGIRFSPHIYNVREDILRIADALAKCV